MEQLDIGVVAERTGLAPSTLRYYERRGLIAAVGRHGLRRQFDPDVVERLALISLARSAGFSLDEARLMLATDGPPRVDRAMLAARADDLDETIRRLSAMRDGLRHAAKCSAGSHLECPTFRRLLDEAGRKA